MFIAKIFGFSGDPEQWDKKGLYRSQRLQSGKYQRFDLLETFREGRRVLVLEPEVTSVVR